MRKKLMLAAAEVEGHPFITAARRPHSCKAISDKDVFVRVSSKNRKNMK
jgi:hypothetical protein